jgi:hypothetical protein
MTSLQGLTLATALYFAIFLFGIFTKNAYCLLAFVAIPLLLPYPGLSVLWVEHGSSLHVTALKGGGIFKEAIRSLGGFDASLTGVG